VLALTVLMLFVAACDRTTAPRPFTLGPGCWTIKTFTLILDDGTKVPVTQKGHYPTCPDPLPTGEALWHWDTTWVDH
jgi:hypothetical protein